ncbi:MAG: hypothetical protein WAO55_11660 [Candidatus Manganitrophaceae bacterium]
MGNVKQCLDEALQIDGAIGAALVDLKSGMCLGTAGGGSTFNLDIAAAGNTEVVRGKLKVMADLGLKDRIEDVLITLGKQYHLIRLLSNVGHIFIYVALHREKANLGMARHKLSEIEGKLSL